MGSDPFLLTPLREIKRASLRGRSVVGVSPFARSLVGILPAWRGLRDRRLPLWALLGRRAQAVGRLQALEAELHCIACRSQPLCRRRIAARLPGPVRGCPNRQLFA
jgi:hypothetical protein